MSTFNVFRWSALAAGVVYGAYHTQVLKSIGSAKQEKADYEHKEKLIAEAKAEFAKSKAPKTEAPAATGATSLSSINLDDPNVDFAKVVLSAVESL